MSNNTDRILRDLCINCNQTTKHILRAEYLQSFDSDDYPEMIDDLARGTWQIWQCQGCETVFFREIWQSYMGLPAREELIVRCYPEKKRHRIIEEKRFQTIPNNLRLLYSEVVTTYNNRCMLLCAVGLRSLIEGLCNDKGITKGPNADGKIVSNLEGKINALKHIIPTHIIDHLHSFRFLGNDAVHELSTPDEHTLSMAIAVIEDILNISYDLDYRTSRLYLRVTKQRSKISPRETQDLDDIPF